MGRGSLEQGRPGGQPNSNTNSNANSNTNNDNNNDDDNDFPIRIHPCIDGFLKKHHRIIKWGICFASVGGMIGMLIPLIPVAMQAFESSSSSSEDADIPNSYPVECAANISSNAQSLGLNDLREIITFSAKIDGEDVILGRTGEIVFYSLDGAWKKMNSDASVCESTKYPNVAISGNTAVVGCYHDSYQGNSRAGVVLVYEKQEETGRWTTFQDPLIPEEGLQSNAIFGGSLDVSGDTIVVGSLSSIMEAFYVFGRNDTSWNQVAKVSPPDFCASFTHFGYAIYMENDEIVASSDCNGGTIFTYRYNETSSDELIYLQNQLDGYAFETSRLIGLSGNYIIYHDHDTRISISYDPTQNQEPFVLHQKLEFSLFDYEEATNLKVAISDDILAIALTYKDHSRIYTYTLEEENKEQGGKWKESMMLVLPEYEIYHMALSDRHLIVCNLLDSMILNLTDCDDFIAKK